MKNMKGILLLAGSLLMRITTMAQGCSDAGFCTAGGLHGASGSDTASTGKTGISFTAGIGEQDVLIFIPQVEWSHNLAKNTEIEVKLPFLYSLRQPGQLCRHQRPRHHPYKSARS
jgi:hypothetical protein